VLEFLDQLRWRPRLGDPSVMGWLTVAAYAAAAVACWRAACRADTPQGRAGGVWRQWMLMTVLMGLLCLNKQLDLQSLLTDIGRVLAREQGWYRERRGFQKAVVLGTLAVSLSGAAFVLLRFRHFWIKNALLFAGLVLLCTFIAVRAISFHHVDTLLRTRFIGMKLNWFLELSGIALVGLAASRARPRTTAD
jgi:hypothetical protein